MNSNKSFPFLFPFVGCAAYFQHIIIIATILEWEWTCKTAFPIGTCSFINHQTIYVISNTRKICYAIFFSLWKFAKYHIYIFHFYIWIYVPYIAGTTCCSRWISRVRWKWYFETCDFDSTGELRLLSVINKQMENSNTHTHFDLLQSSLNLRFASHSMFPFSYFLSSSLYFSLPIWNREIFIDKAFESHDWIAWILCAFVSLLFFSFLLRHCSTKYI